MPLKIHEHVPLSSRTTLGLGGPARFLFTCDSIDAIGEALTLATREALPLFVLGGGSNVVVADKGFSGAVLQPAIRGISVEEVRDEVLVTAGAGEAWDDLVRFAVDAGYGGIECLSGIPGSVGATPIQNVGAYGQEVKETVHSVEVIERATRERRVIAGAECEFGYRSSRFKAADAGRYIVTAVRFRLRPGDLPVIRYPELQRAIAERHDRSALQGGRAALAAVRAAVLSIRRSKSMVVDPSDPESRSAGSFFMNPVLDQAAFMAFRDVCRRRGEEPPAFPADGGTKVPAAWLVERAGFARGFRRGGVGISAHHALALVNYSGTASELLALAGEVREAVLSAFGVSLAMEPIILE